MANDPASEVSTYAVSEMGSFGPDIAKLMMQSKELYESYLLTYNLDDMQQAARCAREIFDLVSPEVSSMPTILLKVVPQDLLYMVPIILYSLARSLLRKYELTRQVEDIMSAMKMFRCAFQRSETYDYVVGYKYLAYLSVSHLQQSELQLKDFIRQSGASLGTVNLGFFKFLCRIMNIDEEMFDSHNLGEIEEMFDYFCKTSLHLNHGISPVEASLKNLNSVIQYSRQALKYFSSDRYQAKKGFIFIMLGSCLLKRSVKQSTLEDVNEAITCCRDGLELVSRTSPAFGSHLIITSKAFLHRLDMLRSREDLDDAVRYANEAKKAIDTQTLRTSATAVIVLEHQAHVMWRLYGSTGDVNDLDAAIHAASRAVDIKENELDSSPNAITPSDNLPVFLRTPSILLNEKRDQSLLLYNLSVFLEVRFQRSGRSEDISEAIAAAQKAVDLLPPNDSGRISSLGQLSNLEFVQCQHFCDLDFLERGAQHFQEAWSIQQVLPESDHAALLGLIHSFACAICLCCFLGPESWENLDKAIAACRKALLPHTHHPYVIQTLDVFCMCLLQRWERIPDEIMYLDEAISIARLMIEGTEEKANESMTSVDELVVMADLSAMARNKLGDSLYRRYKSIGDIENCHEALAVLMKGFRMFGVSPAVRAKAGQLAIDVLSEMADWDTARNLSQEVLDLLVILNGRSLGWQDKHFWLSRFSSHAATYASIALEAGSNVWDVIDTLERCRGSVLGHLVDNRTDLNDLTEAAPEEAERLRTLINEINMVINPSGNSSTITRVKQITRRIEAEGEIRVSLQKIRTLEGFDRFLLGPTKRELKAVAARGPIVLVNISSIRSDAIIITEDDSVLLSLPEMKYEKAKEYRDAKLNEFSDIIEKGQKNKRYQGLQKWLWNTCVKSILEKLDGLAGGPAKFHVRWIGIGIASSLPFHAAGIYTGNFSETALSRAFSSYAPSIKVLIYATRKLRDDPPIPDKEILARNAEIVPLKPQLSIIVMPSTPGMDDLKGVQQEAEEVQKIVQDTYSARILLQPSAKDAKMHMEECEIVHFACHGRSTLLDPSRSHLLLQATTPDSTTPVIDELTLRDVIAADLSHGKLAVLSACSTAQDKANRQWDEGLHLASGFQVAGYLHVIGNLWPSDDEVSVQIVTEFYRHLIAAGDFGDGGHVARALNEALISVAGQYTKQPLSWAQFVHFGV